MYKAREQKDILHEMQGWSNTPASKIEGTFEYDMLAANAIEFAKVEVELEETYRQSFGTTATGEYLTMRAAESGILRKAAAPAHGVLTVRGRGVVRAGSLFATDGGVQFAAVTDTPIMGSGQVEVEAVEAGAGGNVLAGTVTKIPLSIPGINGVTNAEATRDGYDAEDDEALRTRYLEHVRYPGVSGNKRHYIEWATAVPGVGAAGCLRAWNGANTVKVIVIDSSYGTASETLIKKVYDYISERNPINAILTVASAAVKAVDVEADIRGQLDEDAFRRAVQAYFKRIAKIGLDQGSYVSIAKIGALLLQDGSVQDYEGLTLNGAAANVPLESAELPHLGRVVLHG
ncbi:baseplate J/gp47 family protein [uncultured Mitsuokella sp.]|uniref:baseplate J/gp47 family protein n=1 Tax=uncultured Mitsuokella sp. TaxID=453120 RepID=UPI002631191B|nr:baseplate J/gp47 family protein [uncultured Mitsuokella sp.]